MADTNGWAELNRPCGAMSPNSEEEDDYEHDGENREEKQQQHHRTGGDHGLEKIGRAREDWLLAWRGRCLRERSDSRRKDNEQ